MIHPGWADAIGVSAELALGRLDGRRRVGKSRSWRFVGVIGGRQETKISRRAIRANLMSYLQHSL